MAYLFSSIAVLALVFAGIGWVLGANWGIRDTERRWSEAVARANDSRARADR